MPRTSPCCLLLLLIVFSLTFIFVVKSDDSDAKILLKFRDSLWNSTALDNWNASILCNGSSSDWNGVLCSKGAVYGLQLESMGLMGFIDVDMLWELSNLRTLSFMHNSFEGPVPDFRKLGALRGLYLSHNRFSGEIPGDAFSGMKSMRRVYLADNLFSGEIPESLTELPKLVELQLQNNGFEGRIPDLEQTGLTANFSNNRLEGPIPGGLSDETSSSFAGNMNLCGKPLKRCNKKSIPKLAIILASLSVALLVAIVLASFFFWCFHRQRKHTQKKDVLIPYKTGENQFHSPEHKKKPYKKDEYGDLKFVRNDSRDKFDLQDLLRASAEVLGSGSFGSSYKAILLGGPAMVVKRFKQMSSVGRGEFEEHMKRLGRLSHPNLLPLVAFYYKKEEKLLITDFVNNGCLASHLHVKRNSNQPGLDWATRLNIIKGVARGLAYLYKELPSLTLPHGHLKSSNVLLDNKFEPFLADYALAPVINKDHAQQFMVAYKSPEFTQSGRTTKKTDVWSLGILILELLTGKFPADYLKQGKGGNSDLATWVNSVVREEWTGEVFDMDMRKTRNGEGEMLKLLKIGMCCCEWNVERRWDLWEAVEKIEELKERGADEDYSSFTSEEYILSSKAVTDDEFSFSVNG